MDKILEPEDLMRLQSMINDIRAGLIVDLNLKNLSLNGQNVIAEEIQDVLELQKRLEHSMQVLYAKGE